jgi:hypothetical protein
MSTKTTTYRHLPLNIPIDMAAGSYWISAEDTIALGNREVLCIIRDTDCITSCCGQSHGFRSIGVIGYIVEWHANEENGRPSSVMEPIMDESTKEEIAKTLRKKYRVEQVEFM